MAFDVSKLPPAHVAAVRRLDVAWMQAFNTHVTGGPFKAARSEVTGEWFESDEIALITLHQVRMIVGNKKEARESREWLRALGLKGAFRQPLDKN